MTTTTTFDVYSNTQALDKGILDVIVTRLEARGKHPTFRRMLDQYLNPLQIERVESLLDLGCGTGFVARQVAARPQFTGRVSGIDISPYLIERAKDLAAEEGVGHKIAFEVGDTQSLGLPSDSFEVVIAHTLVSHLADPLMMLKEMRRVVKPQGFVAIFDGDYASLTFSHPDASQGKTLDELIISSIVTQPRVMRQMPLLLNEAGFTLVSTYANVVSDISRADFWAPLIESLRKLLPTAKTMTVQEANIWADTRLQESADGVFFGSSNYFTYVARKA